MLIFESQKMSFGLHQSTTYENSHKMTTSEVMLWCRPNDNSGKIIDFVKVIECEKNSFGLDQSTTYENNHKMTTSEVMLWCQPNDNLVKIIDFVKVIECENNLASTRCQKRITTKQTLLARRRFTETK